MSIQGQERLLWTVKEMDRLSVIQAVLKKKLTWREASQEIRLSIRQIGNLVAQVRKEGSLGIRHRLKGKPSNHQLPKGLIPQALHLIKTHYADFGPLLACEKLETHGIKLSKETLRQAMIKKGIWQTRPRKPQHRSWRPRRLRRGELVQLDASYHDWFEGRAPECALIAYVDDATSKILHAEFVLGEDTMTLFKTTWAYLLRWGRPQALYVDKHSVFHVNKQTMVEPHLRDPQPMTQFTQAMSELGIEVIPAHSPQAKGRVERSFQTLQDRLIKELRLLGISSITEANQFLWKEFLPDYNERFGQTAASSSDAHRPLLPQHNLKDVLSLKTQRRVMNDWTIRFRNQFFQILQDQPLIIKPKDKVIVIVRLDSSVHLQFKGQELRYKSIIRHDPWPWDPRMCRHFKNRSPKPKLETPASLASHWQVSLRFQELMATIRADQTSQAKKGQKGLSGMALKGSRTQENNLHHSLIPQKSNPHHRKLDVRKRSHSTSIKELFNPQPLKAWQTKNTEPQYEISTLLKL